MAKTIQNAANIPLNVRTGTVPSVGQAMTDWFQPMTFSLVTKSNEAFQDVETVQDISFFGVIQPLTNQQLYLKPEGQRAWKWFKLHAQPELPLKVDDVVYYNDNETKLKMRVVGLMHYEIYGYIEYSLCQDWADSTDTGGVLSYGVLQYGMEMPGV